MARAQPEGGDVVLMDRGRMASIVEIANHNFDVAADKLGLTAEEKMLLTTRDPEDRFVDPSDWDSEREKMFDKTIADSFPASDPPSSVPNPREDSF
jgi:hypothetical protein